MSQHYIYDWAYGVPKVLNRSSIVSAQGKTIHLFTECQRYLWLRCYQTSVHELSLHFLQLAGANWALVGFFGQCIFQTNVHHCKHAGCKRNHGITLYHVTQCSPVHSDGDCLVWRRKQINIIINLQDFALYKPDLKLLRNKSENLHLNPFVSKSRTLTAASVGHLWVPTFRCKRAFLFISPFCCYAIKLK